MFSEMQGASRKDKIKNCFLHLRLGWGLVNENAGSSAAEMRILFSQACMPAWAQVEAAMVVALDLPFAPR